MAARRERKLPPEFIKQFIEAYDIKNTDDIKAAMADMLGSTLQGMLESELEDDLGYRKYDYENKNTENSRNGYSPNLTIPHVAHPTTGGPQCTKSNAPTAEKHSLSMKPVMRTF